MVQLYGSSSLTSTFCRFKGIVLGSTLVGLASFFMSSGQALSFPGLFHPRSSERFFSDGLEQIEDDIDCLIEGDRCWWTSEEELLNIDVSIGQSNHNQPLESEQWLLEELSSPSISPKPSNIDNR